MFSCGSTLTRHCSFVARISARVCSFAYRCLHRPNNTVVLRARGRSPPSPMERNCLATSRARGFVSPIATHVPLCTSQCARAAWCGARRFPPPQRGRRVRQTIVRLSALAGRGGGGGLTIAKTVGEGGGGWHDEARRRRGWGQAPRMRRGLVERQGYWRIPLL